MEAGSSRGAVEQLVARALAGRDEGALTAEELAAAYVDAEELWEEEQARGAAPAAAPSAAELFIRTAAAELLLEQRCPRGEARWHLPGYGLGRLALDEGRAWRWYARQLAALVLAAASDEERERLSEELRASGELEQAALAGALYPELVAALPEALQPWLVRALPAVSWRIKGAHCQRLLPEVLGSRPAPELGSVAWQEELALAGVAEEEVCALHEDVFGDHAGGTVYNLEVFHSFDEVRWRVGGRLAALLQRRGDDERLGSGDALARHVLQSAVIFHAFWRDPETAELDYQRVCGWTLDDARGGAPPYLPLLRRWMSRQIAACLVRAWQQEGGAPSWVAHVQDQFFGFTEVDPVLFPWLVADVPVELHPALLAASSTVAWKGKRDFLARLAEEPARHPALGEALASSCTSGVFHSIDAREGLALLARLGGIEAERRAELRALLEGPVEVRVLAAAEPAASRYRDEHPGRCFLALAFASPWPMWLMDADLWLGEACLGGLATWYHGRWPEGPTTGRQGLQRDGAAQPVPVSQRRDDERAAGEARDVAWHAIELPYPRAAALVGRAVQLKPRL